MKKTANIATMPSRLDQLSETIKSLEPQFDEIRIYLNEFKEIPKWLKNYTIATGDNLTDNGKFYFLQFTQKELYFSCDDDIIYPPTYSRDMAQAIEDYGTIVTQHGRTLINKNVSYYGGHEFYHCANEVIEAAYLDVPGTGVTAFNTEYFKPVNLYKSPDKCMSDIIFGLEAKAAGKKCIVLPHACGYIKPLQVNDSIYKKHRHNEARQIEIANKIIDLKKYFH